MLKIGTDRYVGIALLSAGTIAMDYANLRKYAHQHCRFKLRGGKEIFGVVWEVETSDSANGDGTSRLFFASVRDYERLQQQGAPAQVISIAPNDIVSVESLAS